jgi:hypothetical protein
LFCAFSFTGIAQELDYATTKEKIYIQTSHVFFKNRAKRCSLQIYVVNAKDQKPSVISITIYVEVINPAGNVLQKLNYKVENGYAEGSYDFDEQAVRWYLQNKGLYTSWMRI